jgi:hypothetical protein
LSAARGRSSTDAVRHLSPFDAKPSAYTIRGGDYAKSSILEDLTLHTEHAMRQIVADIGRLPGRSPRHVTKAFEQRYVTRISNWSARAEAARIWCG